MAPSKGRSRFQADLKSAAEKSISNISGIGKGDAEDEFTFLYTHSSQLDGSRWEIRVQPQDTQSYPDGNYFLTYTNHDVPREVAQVLDDSIAETSGMKVVDMLGNLSRRLRAISHADLQDAVQDIDMVDADDLGVLTGDDDSDLEHDYDDADLFDDDVTFGIHRKIDDLSRPMDITSSIQQRFRSDLLSVFKAGFHTGKACGFDKGSLENIIWISIRVSKLHLSREVREAWDLASSDYIILLIQYLDRYTSFEDAVNMPARSSNLAFRLRKSSKKKPTYDQAVAAFSDSQPRQQGSNGLQLYSLWISKSIESFMDGEFLSLLKLRHKHAISWEQAKDMLLRQMKSTENLEDVNFPSVPDEQSTGDERRNHEAQLPSFLIDDHLLSKGETSLQLVAFQFALHYLVRCTDYCTICHRKSEGNFDALKPYVCSQPLCLFQYMNLGFGPSIEAEIINQPKVVDLLISLCFVSLSFSMTKGASYSMMKSAPSSTTKGGMREFPTGLNLQVPKIRRSVAGTDVAHAPHRYDHVDGRVLVDSIAVSFNKEASIATITGTGNYDLREGQCVVVVLPVQTPQSVKSILAGYVHDNDLVLLHARIDLIYDTRLTLDIMARHTMPDQALKGPLVGEDIDMIMPANTYPGYIVPYNQEMDSLESELEKAFSMSIILASLPSVEEMRSYLMTSSIQSLAKWERMTKAAVDLLRWIIASNRSYIVQVDGESTDARPHERISGVDGWIQFRFAQGSLENDVRFNQVLEGIDKPQKTLVAWHGSALGNWHSIIRQGLDFTKQANGRAYGNGIYFSNLFDTSLCYSHGNVPTSSWQITWPQSSLRVASVISLNELVNFPERFISSNPHYVVQVCHWTRCRYLFVKPSQEDHGLLSGSKVGHGHEFVQDPKWVATGPGGSKLFIPKGAIPSAQRERSVSTKSANDASEAKTDSSDDEEDLKFLHGDNIQTDFRPGTLDYGRLPMLAPPSYATGHAQKTLGHEIKKLHRVQSTTPLHQLGWYIDFDKLNNMFQWIVEFHSFDQSLPLAKDMKARGITSIILEMRFLSSFPLSPPFVRVISPRFLPFATGGGGHVTAGGAMCMELLTNTGWSPANSLESVLLQVRLAMCSEKPPARLERHHTSLSQYGIHEAIDAYTRAAQAHNWEVPKDLRDLRQN
ncbi:hypothetical protein GGR53DRAFT_11741 [Hypoxylon sp. FL1150]|nr:hypothetical protein GGR53DRAFT_11741 [Hypoxylon sp. FL1150]